MSEQTVETSIETEFQPNEEGELKPQTMEDKFFGVKTEIKKSEPQDDVSVEVIDDTPEEDRRPPRVETKEEPVDDEIIDKEITDYSKRAGDRINKIKYEYHEERRAKEAAERQTEEAVNALQTLRTENQRLMQMVQEGSKTLTESQKNNVEWAKRDAQARLKQAYENDDAEAMAKAQEQLSQATVAERDATQYEAHLNQQIQQLSQQTQNQIQQPEMQIDKDMQEWSNKNTWFMNNTNPQHQRMTSFAMYLDQEIRDEGIDPAGNPTLYYDEVDKRMRNQFPNFFGVEVEQSISEPVQEKKQPSNVVAPATRNSGSNKNPRNIRLTQSQVNLARKLGVTPEQYAKELLKE